MFDKLYKLIFGLEEYSKTKIELRIELAQELVNDLEVNSIEDFDVLESCIYKIKDQLRVKSSNLNNVIRDKNKDLNREKVENFLNELLELRSTFLNTAFDAIKKNKQTPPAQPTQENKESKTPLSFSTSTYTLSLQTQGGLHVKLEFFEQVNYKQLRIISSIIFDELQVEGTTIIVEKNTAYIIPRTTNDQIIAPLPQNKDDKAVEESFKKLTATSIGEENYEENVEVKPDYISKYSDEESLDNIISNYDRNAKNAPSHEEEESSSISVEKDDPISVEKKEQKKPQEISIEREGDQENSSIFYQDEEIIAKGSSNASVFGQIDVMPHNNKSLNQLEETQFSYLFLFSKIFASTLFDVLQAHGTTIMWDTQDKAIKIIPRYKDDQVLQQWSGVEMDEQTLSEIQHQLLQKLSNQGSSQANSEETPQQPPQQEEQPQEKQPKQEEDSSKKKAKALLDELRKIP